MSAPLQPIAPLTGFESISGSQSATKSPSVAAGGESFAAALSDIVSSANADLKKAEAVSISAVHGKAETQEVVNAMMTAEQSLRMAVAVRDKIVQAYLDISRMQI